MKSNRERYLLRVYGITLKQYGDLLKSQGNACAVCRKPAEKEKKSLSVDHDHVTGEIRGLLCGWCNHKRVGRYRDADTFESISRYLRQGTGLFVPKKKKKRKKRVRRS